VSAESGGTPTPRIDVWATLARSVPPKAIPGVGDSSSSSDSSPGSRLRPNRLLDTAGLVFWLYILVKVFVIDLDRVLLRAVSPGFESLVDFRILLYLAIFAIVLALGRRRWLRLLYVALFPLVVLFWKLPYLFWRHKSWPVFLATLQTIASISVDLRYRLTVAAVWLIATICVLFVEIRLIDALAVILLVAIALASTARFIVRTIAKPSFTALQRRWIERLLKTDQLRGLWRLTDEYSNPGIERYTDTQVQQVAMKISTGVMVNKLLYVWAYRLDEYRRKFAPALIFAAISFVWLFLTTVFTLSLGSLALDRASSNEYVTQGAPTLANFVVHTLAALMGGEAGAIQASGQMALWLQSLVTVIGVIGLVSVILNVGLTVRRERDEAATKELADELRERAAAQEQLFIAEYSVGTDEARRRLETLGSGFTFLVTYFTRSMPDDLLPSTNQG
jgi:hypothetical protein